MHIKTMNIFALFLCLFVLFSFTVTGCGQTADKAAENIIEESINQESGEDVDIDVDSQSEEVSISTSDGDITAKTGAEMEWPDNIPNYVPQLVGDIVMVMQTGETESFYYNIAYENIKDAEMEPYVTALENSGWVIQMKTEMEDAWMINAVYDEKVHLTASINPEEKTGAIMLNAVD